MHLRSAACSPFLLNPPLSNPQHIGFLTYAKPEDGEACLSTVHNTSVRAGQHMLAHAAAAAVACYACSAIRCTSCRSNTLRFCCPPQVPNLSPSGSEPLRLEFRDLDKIRRHMTRTAE